MRVSDNYLAALVLEPDADHSGTQAGHLGQLLLHQRVWTGVGAGRRQVRKSDEREFLFLPVASFEDVQLLLAENSPAPKKRKCRCFKM